VDHFQNRNRMARLISAIAAHPDRLGIGIDEDTCAMVEGDGLLQVMGKGTVTIVDPGKSYYTTSAVGATDPLSLHNHGSSSATAIAYHHQRTVLAPVHRLPN